MEFNRDKQLSLLLGAGLGAGLMLALDPARKRGIARDKTVKGMPMEMQSIRRHSDVMGPHLTGIAAEIWARRLPPPSDLQLEKRVRSELGHHIKHGWTIEVVADDGFVVLRGNVLLDQLEDAVSTARDVNGVRKVWSEMRVRNSPSDTIPLQS
jgi:hypothetical protein